MYTFNRSLPGILRLFIAYDCQETLTQDEFLAIDHYRKIGYGLEIVEVFDGDDSVLEHEPDDYLLYQAQEINEFERIIYYLVKKDS